MVAKFLDLNNLSWGRRSFALSNDRGKVWATVLFLSAIMHRKFIHVNFFAFSSCYISRTGTVCWDPEMLLPWQRYVTTSPLYWQCFEDILGGEVSSVDCTYGLATKRYWTQHFNGKFLVLIRFPVISIAPCKEIQDSLGFWIPCCGFRIPGIGFRIPAQWIPVSKKSCIPFFSRF